MGVRITHRVQVVTEDDGRIAFTINPFSVVHMAAAYQRCRTASRAVRCGSRRVSAIILWALRAWRGQAAARRLARVSSLLTLSLLSLLSSLVLAQPCWHFLVRRASTTQRSQGGGRPGSEALEDAGGRPHQVRGPAKKRE
jgi:hypothetical protein